MILILFGGLRRQTLRGFFDKLRGEGEILLLFFRPIVESLVENHFLCPLQNVFPLQFCQRTEYGQHEAALWGGGVDVLFQTDKLHALSASIERNLIVTGLYPNEIGRKRSRTRALLLSDEIIRNVVISELCTDRSFHQW